MANSITPPSWHEDQPNSAEAAIANTLASKNMALGGTLLNEYASHRAFAQNDYHDYMQQVNAVQMANIAQAHAEASRKAQLDAMKLSTPGAYQMFASTDPSAPAPSDEFTQSVRQAAQSENVGKAGAGLGHAVDAGITFAPGAFGKYIEGATGVGPGSREKAATIIANSHLGAAAIGAGARRASDGKTVLHVPLDPNDPSAGTKDVTIPAGRPIPTEYAGAPPVSPQLPPAPADTTATTGAGNAPSSPTAAATDPTLKQRTIATIHQLKATGNTRGAADMMRAVQEGQFANIGGRDGFAHNGKFYPVNR